LDRRRSEGARAGVPVKERMRKHDISEWTFYRWRSKYGGMEASEAERLRKLEEENRKLKQIVAEKDLDIRALKAVVEKRWWAPINVTWRSTCSKRTSA
jgi:putative transposase